MEVLVKLCECEPCGLSPLGPVQFGFCHCRCGLPAPIAKETDRRQGYIKGQPVRFISGHYASLLRQDPTERYWPKVDKNGPIIRPELGQCWLFTGYRNKYGYGVIWDGRRTRLAHHIALEFVGFVIPFEGLQVLHLCDNPPCVRPDHLLIGTAQDDADDKISKGRQPRGENVHTAKLRQIDVDEIRRLYRAGGTTQEVLAQRFGVNQSRISDIIRGKTWNVEVPA